LHRPEPVRGPIQYPRCQWRSATNYRRPTSCRSRWILMSSPAGRHSPCTGRGRQDPVPDRDRHGSWPVCFGRSSGEVADPVQEVEPRPSVRARRPSDEARLGSEEDEHRFALGRSAPEASVRPESRCGRRDHGCRRCCQASGRPEPPRLALTGGVGRFVAGEHSLREGRLGTTGKSIAQSARSMPAMSASSVMFSWRRNSAQAASGLCAKYATGPSPTPCHRAGGWADDSQRKGKRLSAWRKTITSRRPLRPTTPPAPRPLAS
jgi:hypothetical protein